MKHKKRPYTIAFLYIVFMLSLLQNKGSVQAAAWNGTYDATWYTDNPDSLYYYIRTAEQFAAIPHIISDYKESFYGRTIYLIANIVLNSTQNYTVSEDGNVTFASGANVWNCVPQTEENAFRGCLDGQNYRIQGMYIPATVSGQHRGLFGRVEKGGEIKNIKIEYFYMGENGSTSVSTDDYSGAVAGLLKEAVIENCSAEKGTIITTQTAGGIAGNVKKNSSITNCQSSCYIEGGYCIGGIAGYSYGDIYDCQSSCVIKSRYAPVYNIGGITGVQKSLESGALKIYRCSYSGELHGEGYYVGGIAGQATDNMKIQHCMVTGNIWGTGYGHTGGITGSAGVCSISQCGVTGNIRGESETGGICGYITGAASIRNSYFAGSMIAGRGGGIYGGSRAGSTPLVRDCVYDRDKAGEPSAGTHTLYDGEGITGVTTEEMESGVGAYYADLLDGGRHLYLWSQGEKYPKPIEDVYQTPVYRVRFFKDTAGDEATVLYTDSMGKLTKNLPEPVMKKGYDVVWDHKCFDNISADTDVYPVYRTKYFTVNFLVNGRVQESRQAAYGTALMEVPEIPYRPGYTGRWGMPGVFSCITGDIDAELVYDPVIYTIRYHGNGAAGEEVRQSCHYDTGYILADNRFEREGYSFAGWNTQSDGSGTAYQDRAAIYNLTALPDMEINLYAMWNQDTPEGQKTATWKMTGYETEGALLSLAAVGGTEGKSRMVDTPAGNSLSGNGLTGSGLTGSRPLMNSLTADRLCKKFVRARNFFEKYKEKIFKVKKLKKKKANVFHCTIYNGG